jgi:undecaprenyl-phosphate galactose phosphotransferase/putative colanic acid biosynthesis UDP-glucose lipid carrier transferase
MYNFDLQSYRAPQLVLGEGQMPDSAKPARSILKRATDIVGAGALLIFVLPLLLVAALAIRLDSKGPVLFRQTRGGLGGRPFVVLKFRTMTVLENGADIRQAVRNDERVTRIGGFLRKTSIDELPQLFNVLMGQMSLVGPRPHAVAHDLEFQRIFPAYNLRFAVRPGITGLAQVRGFRGNTSAKEDLEGRLALDLHYIDNWSFWKDIGLLLNTLRVPLDNKAY